MNMRWKLFERKVMVKRISSFLFQDLLYYIKLELNFNANTLLRLSVQLNN